MLTWSEVLKRTDAGAGAGADLRRIRFRLRRVPLIVTGNAGAGKTRIWSILTRQPYREVSSLTKDDGYLLRPNRNGAITLTTIPGQICNGRYAAMEYYFRESRALHGVVFVAANGFDHVWPDKRNDVSRQLTRYQLDYLRKRNRRKELDRFKETCQVLAERLLATDANTPRWLLVVANKADLYWNEIAAAEKYYLPGSGSDFDDVAQELLSEVGRGNLQYDVLPLATAPVDYRFQSTRGLLESRTQLNTIQCSASIACLAEALEARCDA